MRLAKVVAAITSTALLGWAGSALASPAVSQAAIGGLDISKARKSITHRGPVKSDFNYDYFQVGYIINSNLEDDSGDEVDGNGLDLEVTRSVGDNFFVRVASMTPDYRFNGLDQTFGDWSQVAAGAYLPLLHTRQHGYPLDVWAQVSYDRIGLQGLATTGYGLAAGLRFAPFKRLELNGAVRYADTSGDLGGSDIDLSPLIFSLDAVYHLSPRIAMTATYRGGEFEVDAGTPQSDAELSQFSLGLRYFYGVETDDLPALPVDPPTSYNYVQASYVVDGDISAGGGDIDTGGGIGLEASALFADNIFLRGVFSTVDYDAGANDAVLSDMAFIGPGVRYGRAFGEIHADVYGQLAYDRLVIGGLVADGYGGEVGTRVKLLPGVEFNAWYRYSRTEFDDNNADADPQLYGARLLLSLPNQAALSRYALVIDYRDGEIELDQAIAGGADLDVSALSVGLRARF